MRQLLEFNTGNEDLREVFSMKYVTKKWAMGLDLISFNGVRFQKNGKNGNRESHS